MGWNSAKAWPESQLHVPSPLLNTVIVVTPSVSEVLLYSCCIAGVEQIKPEV